MDWDCCVYRNDIECHCYPDGCRTCVVNPYAVDDEEEQTPANIPPYKDKNDDDSSCVRGDGTCTECPHYTVCFAEREEED